MALTLVQSSTIASGAAVSSQATSFASLPTAGNMIVVLVSAWRAVPGANIASVSDNQGNTYTKVIDRNGGNSGLNEVSIWYCASIGTPSGTHTVTANPTAGANNYIVVIASEVSGQDTSAPLDASTSAAISTTGDVATGTTATLAQADEIVFIAAGVSASNANIAIDTPAGYTRIGVQQDSNTYIGFEGSHKIVSATTAVVGQWSHDNTGQDEASGVIATFKAAAGGASISAFQHDAFQGGAFQFGAIVASGGVDVTVTPSVGSLTLTGFAGTLTADSSATPGLQALVITGLAPTVTASFSATPGVGSLILTGFAASVAADSSAAPGVQALALTGFAPTVDGSSSATPGVGSLTLTGYAPTLDASSSATPDVQALIITGYAPTVTADSGSVDVTVTPGAGSLVLTGFAPTLSADSSVTPDVGSLTITGYEPEVSIRTGGGGADGVGIPSRKKKKKRIYEPHELEPPKSVQQQVEEFLAERDRLAQLPAPKPKNKKKKAEPVVVPELTAQELEAMEYWRVQAEIDAEEEDIIMLLLDA